MRWNVLCKIQLWTAFVLRVIQYINIFVSIARHFSNFLPVHFLGVLCTLLCKSPKKLTCLFFQKPIPPDRCKHLLYSDGRDPMNFMCVCGVSLVVAVKGVRSPHRHGHFRKRPGKILLFCLVWVIVWGCGAVRMACCCGFCGGNTPSSQLGTRKIVQGKLKTAFYCGFWEAAQFPKNQKYVCLYNPFKHILHTIRGFVKTAVLPCLLCICVGMVGVGVITNIYFSQWFFVPFFICIN